MDILNDGWGTTPTVNTIQLYSGDSVQIEATPRNGYTFKKWSVTSGNIDNPNGSGYPDVTESFPGWGGGSYPWEIVDGFRNCPKGWQCGIAFCGGTGTYCQDH